MSLFIEQDLADLKAGKASAASQVLAAVQIERLRRELANVKRKLIERETYIGKLEEGLLD